MVTAGGTFEIHTKGAGEMGQQSSLNSTLLEDFTCCLNPARKETIEGAVYVRDSFYRA